MEEIKTFTDLTKIMFRESKINKLQDFINMGILNEMKLMYELQTKRIIENDLTLYYPDGEWLSKIFSKPGFLLNIDLPIKNHNYVYIRMLYIPEEYRNKKIGKFLFEYNLDMAKKMKFNSIQVEATEESLNFWKKLGFKMLDIKILRMIYYV